MDFKESIQDRIKDEPDGEWVGLSSSKALAELSVPPGKKLVQVRATLEMRD